MVRRPFVDLAIRDRQPLAAGCIRARWPERAVFRLGRVPSAVPRRRPGEFRSLRTASVIRRGWRLVTSREGVSQGVSRATAGSRTIIIHGPRGGVDSSRDDSCGRPRRRQAPVTRLTTAPRREFIAGCGQYSHCMGSAKMLGTFRVVALLATLTGCGAGTAATANDSTPRESLMPAGELRFSGAITAPVTVGNQDSRAACQTIRQTPPPPATNSTTLLTGEVDFGSGPAAVVLSFQGVAGITQLPLPGESIPASVDIVGASAAQCTPGRVVKRAAAP